MGTKRGKYRKNYIQEIRGKMALEELAEKVGLSNQQVSNIELSKSRLSADQIYDFARALDCHPIEILDGPGATAGAKNEEEKEVLSLFRELTDKDQDRLIGYIEGKLRRE